MFLITHLIYEPIRRFFLGIGGLCRWCFFQLLNLSIEEKYPTKLNYFLNHKDSKVDKNGFTTAQKNLLVSFIIFRD